VSAGDSAGTAAGTVAGGNGVQALAEQWGLRPLGGRPGLFAYFRELWNRRYFAVELARSRFRSANEADRLGVAWIVLRPLINAAVYGIVFGYILISDSRPAGYLPFLVTGIFVFQFFAGCLADGARSIVANMGLVTTLHFPRAVLPFSVVYQQLLGLYWMLLMLGVIVLASGNPIRVSWLQVIPAVALFTLFNLGVAFVAARVTIHLRDIAQLLPFVTRLFFYLSGVFASMQGLLRGNPTLLAVAEANPIYVYITLVRVALLGEQPVFADPQRKGQFFPYDATLTWTYALAWALGMLIVGFVFFWHAEDKYGRE
jgi:teichoic acid transport system permease protein